MPKHPQVHEVVIDKLVHGGQGLGTLADGKKALVWNVLPGEKVRFSSRRSKSSYVEGVAEEILEASQDREEPRDELYLSTSPWQMMEYGAENKYKQQILEETLRRAGVEYEGLISFEYPQDSWHYRSKMEYSFYGDDDGLHLALYNRGTHHKQIVGGSSIARPEIDKTANQVCDVLNAGGVRASDLKSLIVRCNKHGETVAALFARREYFGELPELEGICKGIAIYFSNPKSPASVPTRLLHSHGDTSLTDDLLGKPISYDVLSFFQVNLGPYEMALGKIKQTVGSLRVTDMYAGVGSIGLSVAADGLKLVEMDPNSAKWAQVNAANAAKVVTAASENALEHIGGGPGQATIFDPPRAGLHARVAEAVLSSGPEKIVYLSCNPSTLARDLETLQAEYKIVSITGYNFFPRTPHIEALAILEKKS